MSRSFKECVCHCYRCSGDSFHRTVLEETVNPAMRPLARILLAQRGGVFAWEKSYVRRLGMLTSSKEVCIAAARLRAESRRNSHGFARFCGVGVSGRRLARLARRVMKEQVDANEF